jgi:NAD(P)-dependent dehydrogenase (short-subunit alcohol dehydrogenase family)
MASSVTGKIAFVTGGASGIGAALTTKLAEGDAQVWIADRQLGPAQELAQRINNGGLVVPRAALARVVAATRKSDAQATT